MHLPHFALYQPRGRIVFLHASSKESLRSFLCDWTKARARTLTLAVAIETPFHSFSLFIQLEPSISIILSSPMHQNRLLKGDRTASFFFIVPMVLSRPVRTAVHPQISVHPASHHVRDYHAVPIWLLPVIARIIARNCGFTDRQLPICARFCTCALTLGLLLRLLVLWPKMEFVDLANQQRQKSDSDETLIPVYFENAMRQVSFNPAILVLALAIYVLLFILGILTNSRVLAIIRRRAHRNPFTFDIRLIELDVLSLCCTNFLSILCFLFVIFDLVYGQWMLPSKMLCRLYLSAEGFSRVSSGMFLVHLVFLCVYFVRKMRDEIETSVPAGPISKIALHYLYIMVLCPTVALAFAVALFQHGDVRLSDADISKMDLENDTGLIAIEKCGLTMTTASATSLAIYGSLCGYVAPVSAFIVGAIACGCRYRFIADLTHRRCSGLTWNYGILFFICHTPAWSMSVYDFFVSVSLIHHEGVHYEHTVAFVNYFAHTISYFTCVGYPVLYLRSLNVNRISTDLSGDSLAAVARDDTAMSLTVSTQQHFSRDASRDMFLVSRQPMRSRTTSMLQVASLDRSITVPIERHASYQALARDREEEDQL